LAAFPSQLPKPALHARTHCPPVQVRLPLVALGSQTELQPPQWAMLLLVLVSQASPICPLQSAEGEVQLAIEHTPLAQEGVPLLEVQSSSQVPQSFRVLVGRSQPSAARLLQLPHSASHSVSWHVPVEQLVCA
jgi:hypothetical protein